MNSINNQMLISFRLLNKKKSFNNAVIRYIKYYKF